MPFLTHPAGAGQVAEPRPTARRLTLATMCVGLFLVLFDSTVVNVALPRIAADTRSTVAGLQWVVDGYLVALASLLLVGGTLADIRGRRRVVRVGLVTFGLGSVGCALAPGLDVLVVARIGQGVGAALLLPGTLAVIMRAYPRPAEQARAIGIWAAVGGLGMPAGPVLGGLAVRYLGWPAVFWLNVPLVAVAFVVTARAVPVDTPVAARRLDLPGALTGSVLLAALAGTLIEGGSAGWTAPVTLLLAGTATLLAAGYLILESVRPDPIVPLELFGHRGFGGANAVALLMNCTAVGLNFLLTLFLQDIWDWPADRAGLGMLPQFLPILVLAPLAGRLTGRLGPPAVMTGGLLVTAAGDLLLLRLGPASGYLTLLMPILLIGIGLSFLVPATVAAAMRSAPADRSGLAAGLNNTARQAGATLGVALLGSLAGTPADRPVFVAGLHVAALGCGLALLAALLVPLVRLRRWR